MNVKALDLHSRHPKIAKQDFLALGLETHQESYDVICNAMVLNCVPTAALRGEMLRRCHQFLKDDGILFLSLPKRCLQIADMRLPSKGLFVEFRSLMSLLGFRLMKQKVSEKIYYSCYQKESTTAASCTQDRSPLSIGDATDVSTFSITLAG